MPAGGPALPSVATVCMVCGPPAASARVRANKELAHLTTERKKPSDPAKAWPVKELTEEMLGLVKHFVQGASPSKLDSGYITRVKQLLNLWTACFRGAPVERGLTIDTFSRSHQTGMG